MAYCAILSQQNRHSEALDHAKYAVKYAHMVINRTVSIAESYATSDLLPGKTEEEIINPLLEIMSKKLLPILYELRSMLGAEGTSNPNLWRKRKFQIKAQPTQQSAHKTLNIRNLFGFCRTNDWCLNTNISSVMQLSPMTLHDLLPIDGKEYEISRESIIEKISYVLIAYFCISTEKRFMAQVNKDTLSAKQAEFWHMKALELASCFLPSECPLLLHIYSSYQKNYSTFQHPIVDLII